MPVSFKAAAAAAAKFAILHLMLQSCNDEMMQHSLCSNKKLSKQSND
jgi:hypothetical protein